MPLLFKQFLFQRGFISFCLDLLCFPPTLNTPQMIVTDIYNHRFHRIFATNENLSSIMERDDIYV